MHLNGGLTVQRTEIEWMPIGSVKPYDKNPRRNDDAVDAVANSIREFGFKSPIIVDKDLVIIAGHTRLKAAKSLGLKEIPVVIASDLSDEQARALRLADNKTGELAEWNLDLLQEELDALEDDFDMELFGFSDDDLEVEDVDLIDLVEAEIPEVPEEPNTKQGQMFRLGKHVLLCGDSTQASDMSRLMGGTKAQLLFTDPPWNVDYTGGTADALKIKNDNLGDEFPQFLKDVFSRVHENLVGGGGGAYVVMAGEQWGALMPILASEGFHWSSTIIWAKDSLVLTRKDYHSQYEPIWYGWEASAPRIHPLEDRTQSDVWQIPRPKKSEEHPTMKPIELVARAVLNSSKKGEIVLDPFGGSGSTLMACEQTGRVCRTMELDPRYCDVIIERWETFTGMRAELVV